MTKFLSPKNINAAEIGNVGEFPSWEWTEKRGINRQWTELQQTENEWKILKLLGNCHV